MEQRITKLIKDVNEGNYEILDAFIELREEKKVLEKLLSDIKEFEKTYITEITNQAMDYPEGFRGYDIKLVSGRESFSYKNISEWSNIEKSKKELEVKYKSLYKVYQTTKERPMSEEGEVYELPEVNYSSSYFKLTKTKK